jgi:argonaute-like protein implicated in RNA metabolism and viral defense
LKEERVLKEKVNLLEKELATLTEKLEEIEAALKEIGDLKIEIKGLKLFLGREHPEFKSQFPGIIKKIYSVRK